MASFNRRKMLGKHWWDTKGGAPFQCSPKSDLDFHVELNEFPTTERRTRPRLPQETQELHLTVFLASKHWFDKLLVATCTLQVLRD